MSTTDAPRHRAPRDAGAPAVSEQAAPTQPGAATDATAPSQAPLVLAVSQAALARVLALSVLALHLANLPAVWFRYRMPGGSLTEAYTWLFGVSGEGKLPTWYSSATLLLCAVLLAVVARRRYRAGDRFRRHWAALSLIFGLMSLDEAASLHERLTGPLQRLLTIEQGPLLFAWVIPGLVFVTIVGLAYVPFLGSLSRRSRLLVVVAGITYVSGALGMEMVGSTYVSSHTRDLGYGMIGTLEEVLEMSGVAVFIYALVDLLRSECGSVQVRLES